LRTSKYYTSIDAAAAVSQVAAEEEEQRQQLTCSPCNNIMGLKLRPGTDITPASTLDGGITPKVGST
jgi:hypothetical protein